MHQSVSQSVSRGWGGYLGCVAEAEQLRLERAARWVVRLWRLECGGITCTWLDGRVVGW